MEWMMTPIIRCLIGRLNEFNWLPPSRPHRKKCFLFANKIIIMLISLRNNVGRMCLLPLGVGRKEMYLRTISWWAKTNIFDITDFHAGPHQFGGITVSTNWKGSKVIICTVYMNILKETVFFPHTALKYLCLWLWSFFRFLSLSLRASPLYYCGYTPLDKPMGKRSRSKKKTKQTIQSSVEGRRSHDGRKREFLHCFIFFVCSTIFFFLSLRQFLSDTLRCNIYIFAYTQKYCYYSVVLLLLTLFLYNAKKKMSSLAMSGGPMVSATIATAWIEQINPII